MLMYPTVTPDLQFVDLLVRDIGWPTMIGCAVWLIRKWDRGTASFKDLSQNTKEAVDRVTLVQSEVETIKSNHLAHLQLGLDAQLSVLQEISSNIKILVDRTPRRS